MQTHTALLSLGCSLHSKYGKYAVETWQLTHRQGRTKLNLQCVAVNEREGESGTPPGSRYKEECACSQFAKLNKDEGKWKGGPNTLENLSIYPSLSISILSMVTEINPTSWKSGKKKLNEYKTRHQRLWSYDKSKSWDVIRKTCCLCQESFLCCYIVASV